METASGPSTARKATCKGGSVAFDTEHDGASTRYGIGQGRYGVPRATVQRHARTECTPLDQRQGVDLRERPRTGVGVLVVDVSVYVLVMGTLGRILEA